MAVCFTVVLVAACGFGLLALWAAEVTRGAVAASLVGEIAEFVNYIETQLPADGDVANTSTAQRNIYLPSSPVIYQAHSSRIGLLGVHRARLIASFYASLQSLNDEIRRLEPAGLEGGPSARSTFISSKLQATLDLGDEALRSLQPIISRHRDGFACRA